MSLVLLFQESAADVTAPILSSPTSSDLQTTTVDLGVTTDEGNGTLYWAIRTGATPLGVAAIKAGTGAVSNGNQAVSTSGAQSLNNVGSLTANTSYYADFVHTDAATNDSNVVSTAQFTTAAVDLPILNSATLAANGTSLTLAFDENVNVGAGGNGGFTVSFSGGAATVSYASGDGTANLVYTVSRTVEAGETGTVSYTQPGNGIEDDQGDDLASFSNSTVTNNSTQDTTAPTLSSATVTGDGATLTMVFSEAVNVGAGGNGGFVATMSGGASALTYSSGDTTNTLIYTFARTIAEGETGTLAYTQPGNGIEDDAGNDLATFSGETVAGLTSLQHKDVNDRHNNVTYLHNTTSKRHNNTALEHNG